MRKFLFWVLLLLVLIPVSNLMAVPIDINHASLTRTIRGTNTIGWSPGDRVLVDAELDPGQFAGAGGEAQTTMRGTDPNGSVNDLQYNDFFGLPHYSRTFAYSADIITPWNLTVSNDGDEVSQTTNTLVGVDTIPFVRNVQLQGAGLEPTISWSISGDVSTKRVDVFLHDADGNRFWRNGSTPASTTSVTIPGGVLEDGEKYTARVKVYESDSTTNLPLSQTETFIDFTPLQNGDPSQVFLPVVGNDPVPGDGLGAPFYFDIDVTASTPIFIDPFVAVGYEYMIGSGDPFFESVTLPSLGDDTYQLGLYDGFNWAYTDLLANSKYFFGGAGIDIFRVLGIEESLSIDPADVTAFITELTFVSSGTFTGSMTPIIKEVDPIPEPATMLLFGTGIVGLIGARIRRKR